MQSVRQPEVAHEVVSAGVDWITATAKHGGSRWDMTEYSRTQRERLADLGADVKQATRQGYVGWQGGGYFYGSREGSTMVVASGATAHEVFRSVSLLADNISRIDLQVTVSTPIERPHLGVQAHAAIKGGSPRRVHPRYVTLIDTHPRGETCNVGRRKSDQYGRLYDKASEAQTGPPRSLWRYEVEHKRSAAVAVAATCARDRSVEGVARSLVWDWFNARGVAPIYTQTEPRATPEPTQQPAGAGLLEWFEKSLSISVHRAINRHGIVPVVAALGLSKLVVPVEHRKESQDGNTGINLAYGPDE